MGRMIHIERLTYRYPGATRDAICELSLDVAAGSLFGLLGPNGSGKTTLVSLLMGLLVPRAGRFHIGVGEGRVRAALVPQEYAFYARLSVLENLRFFAGIQAVADARRITDVIEIAGLHAYKDVRAQRLSGGLKRRLNLAIGLLAEPELLFLDEPTVGIDPQSRHFILEAIARINAAGTTIVYSSHYMEEVQLLCNEIGILDQGRLLAHGDLGSLLASAHAGQLEVGMEHDASPRLLAALQAFDGLHVRGRQLHVERCASDRVQPLLAQLARSGMGIRRIRYGHADLEGLFLHLTGHQLRE